MITSETLKYIKIPDYKTRSGKTITNILSYQTFGPELGTAPIVLVNHTLTGNANVAGVNGWWSDLIGDGKCIDTNIFTVLAFNVPGNGFDNNSVKDYRALQARHIAQLFLLGLEQLKIDTVFAVIGGSTGGGIAWEMAALKPYLFENLIPIAADWKSTDWVIANCHIQDSILNNSKTPLFNARMHAMTLYRTPASFTQKFNRESKSDQEFQVESWLNYHGANLTSRFKLSAYKIMNQLLRTIDITSGRGSFIEVAATISSNIHLVSISTDLLFKREEIFETYNVLKTINTKVTYNEIDSIHGHDAFLIAYQELSAILTPIFNTHILGLNQSKNKTIMA